MPMFNNISFNKEKPIYFQIYTYIKELIALGMLPKDSKLPSTRELASLMSVSRNSIIKAYELLEDDNLIYKVSDKGTFVSSSIITEQNNWNITWGDKLNSYASSARALDIIKSEPPFKKGMISFKSIAPDESIFDLDEFKRDFQNRMSLEGDKLLSYGYALGYKPLIDHLFNYMESKGVNVKGKRILITNGFTEGFDILLSSLTNPGDKILCENPTHNTAIKQMKLHKLDILGIPMCSDGIDTTILKTSLNNEIKLAYLTPSYHNPTGIVMSYEKRKEVYELFKSYGIPILEDGFNEELQHLGSHIAPIAAFDGKKGGTIYLGSLSKILFPGLRIGWILADEELIDILESVKRSRNIHTSVLDQALLYEYLTSGSFEKYLKKTRKFYKDKFDFALELTKKYIPHEYVWGNGGLHLFIKLKNIDSRELLKECYKRSVTFLPGDVFYTDLYEKDTFRLGFSRLSLKQIEEGINIIGTCIENLK
jgi:DNA-binding transcriptional MocR family regulator